MQIDFVKMEGLGNDFILIDDRQGCVQKSYPELAKQLCSRHFGIGADGIILILDAVDHDIKFRIYNSDGSEAQMCGNGIRCFAKYLYEQKILTRKKMQVDTKAGIVIPEVMVDDMGQVSSVRVDMGEPVLVCKDIPFDSKADRAIETPLTVGNTVYSITAVSMGNPHAVIFVEDVDQVDIEQVGRSIETHALFPEKTNVEFVQVVNNRELKMKVWERGAGITLACGTGACASLVAASLTGRVENTATIHLDGGDLDLYWDKDTNHIFKTGPATRVFEGRMEI